MVTVSTNMFLRVMTTVFVMIMPLAAIGSAGAEPAVESAETGVLTGRHAPSFDLDNAGEITVLEYRTEAPTGGTTLATGVLAVPHLRTEATATVDAVRSHGYDRPIFLAHGYADLAVPIPATAVLLARMSAAGTRYEFRVYDGDHRTTPGLARADVDDFLRRVLA